MLSKYDNVADPKGNTEMFNSLSRHLKSPCPLWTGLMQLVHKGKHPGAASVQFLPMIDLNPGDPSCIFSTLCYIESHAKRHNVKPVITFDQPLWLKAKMIQKQAPSDSNISSIVVRLGGFHTLMSFLGCGLQCSLG